MGIEVGSAGRGIRALSVDHELVAKAVLVQSGRCGQNICLTFPVPGDTARRLCGKAKMFVDLWVHAGLLPVLSIKIADSWLIAVRRECMDYFGLLSLMNRMMQHPITRIGNKTLKSSVPEARRLSRNRPTSHAAKVKTVAQP